MTGDAVADRRVHPGTVAIRFIKDVPRTLIGLPALAGLASDIGWSGILGLALGLAVILGLFQWLAWRRFSYGVGASEILIESGLLSRNRRSIPFDRIQDLDIERGPLHRLFGLAKVKIETGAGGKDEGVLDSVTLAEADRLRAEIRAGRHTAPDAAAHAEAAPELVSRTIFSMSPRRLFVAGLFNFSLLWVAGLFGLLQTFDNLLPFSFDDIERWIGLANDRLAGRVTIGAVVAGLVLAALLGVLTGIVRTFSQDWGFRLLAEGNRLRRMRGLFTRTEVVVPKRRVQLALLRTGPLRKRLGIAELLLQTLGSSKGQGGLQNVAPFARAGEIDGILAALPSLRLPGETRLQRVSSRHILRAALRIITIPAALILVGAWFRPEALPLLGVLPLLLVHAALRRRYHLYGLADDFLFVATGFWRRRLWALPMRNAQTVRLSRSPLQRWLGLATLTIDTAGAPVLGGPRIVDLPLEAARDLRDHLLATLRYSRESGKPAALSTSV